MPEATTDEVTVTLVGGPADWRGHTLTYPTSVLDDDVPGAYLISTHTPDRPSDEDPAPRAVYEADADGDPTVWRFRGWLPSAPTDPDPADYPDT